MANKKFKIKNKVVFCSECGSEDVINLRSGLWECRVCKEVFTRIDSYDGIPNNVLKEYKEKYEPKE